MIFLPLLVAMVSQLPPGNTPGCQAWRDIEALVITEYNVQMMKYQELTGHVPFMPPTNPPPCDDCPKDIGPWSCRIFLSMNGDPTSDDMCNSDPGVAEHDEEAVDIFEGTYGCESGAPPWPAGVKLVYARCRPFHVCYPPDDDSAAIWATVQSNQLPTGAHDSGITGNSYWQDSSGGEHGNGSIAMTPNEISAHCREEAACRLLKCADNHGHEQSALCSAVAEMTGGDDGDDPANDGMMDFVNDLFDSFDHNNNGMISAWGYEWNDATNFLRPPIDAAQCAGPRWMIYQSMTADTLGDALWLYITTFVGNCE